MRLKTFYLLIFIGLLAVACKQNRDQIIYRVADNAHILTDDQKSNLIKQIKELEQSVGSQIAILIIESLEGEKIEAYSLRIAENWEIGRKDYDDGVLITIALHDRQTRIEVGYGLEKIIKDEIAAQIIRENMIPNFRTENYYEGLRIAVDKIKTLIKGNQEFVGQRF